MKNNTSTTTLDAKMRCRTEFHPCGCTIHTDVPKVYGGEGHYAAPGDLLAATVASCMLSMMALTGRKHGMSTDGMTASACCEEANGRIQALHLEFCVPGTLTAEQKTLLQQCTENCPVGNALSDKVQKHITWKCCESGHCAA